MRLTAPRRAASARQAISAISSARSETPRRCSAARGAKATRRASRPNCMCRSRSAPRASSPDIADFYGSMPNVSEHHRVRRWRRSPGRAGRVPQSVRLVAAAGEPDRDRRGAWPADAGARLAAGRPGRGHLPLWLSRRSRRRALSPALLADAAQFRQQCAFDLRRSGRVIRRSPLHSPNGWPMAAVNAIIRILDNRTYAEAISLNTAGATGNTLAIEAADGRRPHLRLTGPLQISGNRPDYAVTLSGLLVEGRVVIDGSLHRLRVLHSTLVPGVSIAETDPPAAARHLSSPASTAAANLARRRDRQYRARRPARLRDHRRRSGFRTMPKGSSRSTASSMGSGIDAIAGPGPANERQARRCAASARRSAARTLVRQIDLATETIFDGHVEAERTQTGCVRFLLCAAAARARRGVIAASLIWPIARPSRPRRRALDR